jgi:hypothetical protein
LKVQLVHTLLFLLRQGFVTGLLLAPRARSLRQDAGLQTPDGDRADSPLSPAHHLVGDAVRLLFEGVAGGADPELGLHEGTESSIACGVSESVKGMNGVACAWRGSGGGQVSAGLVALTGSGSISL